MKFDNFVKYAGSDGAILETSDGEKWLFYDNIGMKVPEGKHVFGATAIMPGYLEGFLRYEDYEPCNLVKAFVPRADSKPSELQREFAGNELCIDISNKAFGFIEKKDSTFLNENETSINDSNFIVRALLVTDTLSVDEMKFKMMVVSRKEEE